MVSEAGNTNTNRHPENMTQQEYIEWALEDILVSLDENVDIIVSWLVAQKTAVADYKTT